MAVSSNRQKQSLNRWHPIFWWRVALRYKRHLVVSFSTTIFVSIFWLKVAPAMYFLTILASVGVVWWVFTTKRVVRLFANTKNTRLIVMLLVIAVVIRYEGFTYQAQIMNFVSPPPFQNLIITKTKVLNGVVLEFGVKRDGIEPVDITITANHSAEGCFSWWDAPNKSSCYIDTTNNSVFLSPSATVFGAGTIINKTTVSPPTFTYYATAKPISLSNNLYVAFAGVDTKIDSIIYDGKLFTPKGEKFVFEGE